MKNPLIFDIVKKFRFKSIMFKYFICQIAILFIPFISIISLSLHYYNQSTLREKTDFARQNIQSLENILSSSYTTLEQNFQFIATNPVFKSYLLTENPSSITIAKNVSEIHSYISNTYLNATKIASVYIYNPQSGYVISSSTAVGNNYITHFADSDCFTAHGEKDIFFRVFSYNKQSYKFLSIKKDIYSQRKKIGTVIYNIDINSLFESASKEFEYYLTDPQKNILYSSPENTDNRITCEFDFSGDYKTVYHNKNTVYAVSKTSCPNIYICSRSNIKTNLKPYIKSVILLSAIPILIALVFSAAVISAFYKYILYLIDITPAFEDKITSNSTNELIYIGKRITSLVEKNRETEYELSKKLIQLKKAQAAALQSQLNPHFLFNTLQMINAMVQAEKMHESNISRSITLLSDLLHAALDTVEYSVLLETEVIYTHKYLQIQKIRYNNKFTVKWNIDTEFLSCRVLKFMFQPILENAVYHGIAPMQTHGVISITAERIENDLYIRVKDNGMGMPPDKLSETKKRLASGASCEKNHIGLVNTSNRLRLMYGDEYGLGISSESGIGTTVTIKLPYSAS